MAIGAGGNVLVSILPDVAGRSGFLVPRSCWRLPRLVWPLQARGEPLPEDEGGGWPGPSAFCNSKILSQQNVEQRLQKNLNTEKQEQEAWGAFCRSWREYSLWSFCWCQFLGGGGFLPSPPPAVLVASATPGSGTGTTWPLWGQCSSFLSPGHREAWSLTSRAQGLRSLSLLLKGDFQQKFPCVSGWRWESLPETRVGDAGWAARGEAQPVHSGATLPRDNSGEAGLRGPAFRGACCEASVEERWRGLNGRLYPTWRQNSRTLLCPSH